MKNFLIDKMRLSYYNSLHKFKRNDKLLSKQGLAFTVWTVILKGVRQDTCLIKKEQRYDTKQLCPL